MANGRPPLGPFRKSVLPPLGLPHKCGKVLLYEPGTSGHRPVILQIVKKVLQERKVDFFAATCDIKTPKLHSELQAIASEENCKLIHILSLDGLPLPLLKTRLRGFRRSAIPIVGTTYMFDKYCTRFGTAVLQRLLKTAGVQMLLSPDIRLEHTHQPGSMLRYLPDPVDIERFALVERSQAQEMLNAPAAEGKTTFLVFGELSERKGLSAIVAAFTEAYRERCDLHLLLIGRLATDIRQTTINNIDLLKAAGACTCPNFRVAEEDVSKWYSLSDYYVTSYPKWFTGSSGTFSRACVAGIPTVAAGHGQVSRIIAREKSGMLFETASITALTAALLDAAKLRYSERYTAMAVSAKQTGERHSLAHFARHLVDAYAGILGKAS